VNVMATMNANASFSRSYEALWCKQTIQLHTIIF